MHGKQPHDGGIESTNVQEFVEAAMLKIGGTEPKGVTARVHAAGHTHHHAGDGQIHLDEISSDHANRISLIEALERELATTKLLLGQRNADLGRITNFIRNYDEEKASFQARSKDADQKLKLLRNNLTAIKDSFDQLRGQLADFEFKNASSTLDGRGAYALTTPEHALLHDLVRSRITRNDVVYLAIKAKLFCYDWYCSTYGVTASSAEEAAAHYFEIGHTIGYNPSLTFDGGEYLSVHKDVALLALNPLEHYVKFGVCEPRRAPVRRPLNVKIIMMQRDEVDLIYPWAIYHGTIFGFHNLVIIDNGSVEPVTSRLHRIAELGARIIYDHKERSDFVAKGEIIANLIKEYDAVNPADFYIPLDCDEFIGLEPEEGVFLFSAEDIFEELSTYKGTKNALVVRTYLDNHPVYPGIFKRAGGQRKTFFSTGSCVGLDRGFNNAKVADQGGRQNSKLIYVHYHHKPHALLQQHARRRLEPFLNDFSTKSLQDYILEKKTGYHSARHLLTNARDYLAKIDDKRFSMVPGFVEFFENVGLKLPFSDLAAWGAMEP